MFLGDQVAVVVGEVALEELDVEARFGREREVQAGCPVESILPDEAIAIGQIKCGEAAPPGIDPFCLEDNIPKIFGNGGAVLVNTVVAGLVFDGAGDGGWSDDVTVKGRANIGAAVIETGNVPAVFQRRKSKPIVHVVCIARGALFPAIDNIGKAKRGLIWVELSPGLADIVVARYRNPQQFGVEIVHEILGAGGPLGDSHLVEFGKNEFAEIAGGHYVGEEQADHLSPDDVLLAQS